MPAFSLQRIWVPVSAAVLTAACASSPDTSLVCDQDRLGLISIRNIRTGEVKAQMQKPAVFKNDVATGAAMYMDGDDAVEDGARMIVDRRAGTCRVGMAHHFIKDYTAKFIP